MNPHRLVWLSGDILPVQEANVNVMSPTFQYGLNVFEGIRCYLDSAGTSLSAFRLDRHIERLFQSSKILRLGCRYSEEDILQAFYETIFANDYLEDIAVRIVLFVEDSGNWAFTGECGLLIAPVPMGKAFGGKDGIHCAISSWERINDRSLSPRIKSGANYINSRMAQVEVLNNGFDCAILLNASGKVSEAPGSCLFIVRNGCLITPPITDSVLESITRETVLNIASNELGMKVIERQVDRTELYISDEIFLCGTAVEIVSVLSVDKILVGNGSPGYHTRLLSDEYSRIVRGDSFSRSSWLSPVSRL